MNTQTIEATQQAEVRDLLDSWHKAVVAGDLDAIMSHYAPDIRSFDAIAQLQFQGEEAYRKHWETCLSMCPGAMTFEIHDLSITAGDDLAFCHYLCRCGGPDENGEVKTSWMRATVCCRNINGRWLVVHEHFSSPFDPVSGKALFEVQP